MSDTLPPAYPPQQPPMGYAPPPRGGAGMAIAALILGILALILFCVWYVSIPMAVVAIVLGVVARRKAAAGEAEGRGMATAGMVLGIVAIIIDVLLLAGFLALLGWASKNPEVMDAFKKQMEEAQRQQQQRLAPSSQPGASIAPLWHQVHRATAIL